MYLLIAKYSDDAERKRIEYALEKWGRKLRVVRPDGITVLVDGEDVRDFLEDLSSRIREGSISLYEVRDAEIEIEEREEVIRLKLDEDLNSVEKFLSFLMAKQRAVLKLSKKFERIYEVYTKKGRAEISTRLMEREGYVDLEIRIRGYGQVVSFLREKLERELEYFR